MNLRDKPSNYGRHEGQQKKRMAEAPVVDKVIDRPAEGDKNIQIRYRPQNGTPQKGFSSDLFTKNGLAASGSESQLGQRVHRIPK
jgi:hypothetical protein